MKKVLFATTAFTALAVGGTALADVSLYGMARLGLYYAEDADNELQTTSRTRFGVTMSGETDSGITFGADMRADQVVDGGIDTADDGRAGSAFVSGAFGTLTFGDTSGADENWVGDLNGDNSLTGLSDYHETAFISNGGDVNDQFDFSNNEDSRPTVRYDFDFAGFGISASADSRLSDIGVGAGYSGNFGDFGFDIGLGYYNFEEFTFEQEGTAVVNLDIDGDGIATPVPVEVGVTEEIEVGGGEQYSAMLGFGFFGADMNVIYTKIDADEAEYNTIGVGADYTFDAVTVGAFYRQVADSDDVLADLDGDDVYGVSAQYDLGGGAAVRGGIVQDYQDDVIGDFGIYMSF